MSGDRADVRGSGSDGCLFMGWKITSVGGGRQMFGGRCPEEGECPTNAVCRSEWRRWVHTRSISISERQGLRPGWPGTLVSRPVLVLRRAGPAQRRRKWASDATNDLKWQSAALAWWRPPFYWVDFIKLNGWLVALVAIGTAGLFGRPMYRRFGFVRRCDRAAGRKAAKRNSRWHRPRFGHYVYRAASRAPSIVTRCRISK